VNSLEYEKLLAQIVNQLFENVIELDTSITRWGYANKIPGASRHEHQIDVSISGKSDLYLVECKCWTNPITVESVLAFYGRLQDIRGIETRTVHGTMATTDRYQPGAEKVGEYFGINLELVKSESEFALRFKGSVWSGLTGGEAVGSAGNVTVETNN
jgi:hypothetical protein